MGGAGGDVGGAGGDALTDEVITALDTKAQAFLADHDLPGLAIAVERGGQVVWSGAWGWADVDAQIPATADTPFTLGSVSKTFIAAALMKSVEAGEISLDANLAELELPFLDNPKIDGEAITLRHLATHTAGIRDGALYDCGYYMDETHASLYREFTDLECPEPVEADQASFLESYLSPDGILYNAAHWAGHIPGEAFAYSNIGASLAAVALERGVGVDFDTLTQTRVFAPLGMDHTFWHVTDDTPAIARRYFREDSAEDWFQLPEYSLATWADGGLKASAHDLGVFLAEIAAAERGESSWLSAASAQVMLSAQTDQPSELEWQGIFWMGGGTSFGHTGGDPGVTTLMFHDRAHDVGVIMLLNATDESDASEAPLLSLYREIFELVGGDFL